MEQNESGFALIAAIGVIAVCVVVTMVITTSVVSAVGSTSMSRATVQSQASAEAGIAVARASVTLGTCSLSGGHYTSTVAPVYDVQVSYLSGSTWIQGCPPGAATSMKIVASGDAQNSGSGRASAGNKTSVSAVFTAPAATAVITASGQAVFSYGAVSATGAGTVNAVSGSSANVYVKNGSLVCNGGAGIGGSVVSATGDVTISNGCKVAGSIYAPNGIVKLDSNTGGPVVNGNVVAKSVQITNSGAVSGSIWASGTAGVTISNALTISGGVYSAGPITVSNGQSPTINGPVNAVGTVTVFGTFNGSVVSQTGDVVIGSNATVGGTVWARSGTFSNTYGGNTGGSVVAKNIQLSGGNVAGISTSGGTATGKIYATATASNTLGSWAYQSMPGNALTVSGSLPLVTAGWNGSSPASPVTPTAVAAPATPTIGDWTDWKFSTSDWPGYSVTTLSGSCTVSMLTSAVAAFGTSNGVVDARNCTSGVALDGANVLALKSNIAIVTKQINFSNGSITSDGSQHSLWLLEEDTVADHQPTCTPPESFSFSGGLAIRADQGVRLMIYTPCAATISSSNSFTGQLYDAQTTLSGGATLTYYALGIPGYDLDTGTTTSSGSSTRDWVEQYRSGNAG